MLLLLGLLNSTTSVAMANISPTSPTITGAGPYTWTYHLHLSYDQNVNSGPAPTSNPVPHTNLNIAGFFTIYDFAGYINGTCAGPAGWTCTAQNVGFTPDDVVPTDNPNIVNITWSYTTGSTILGQPSGQDLGLFSAHSIYGLATPVSYSARGIANSGLQTGSIADNVGNTQGPGLAQPGPTYTVTTTAPTDDGNCGVVHCTLREAINAANGDGVASVVELATATTYTLTVADNGSNGLPIIASDITLNGHGSTITRDSGAEAFRIFQVNGSGTLRLNAVTISAGSTAGYGGAVFNGGGTLNVTNTTFSNNHATNDGGAIYAGGTTNVSSSTFTGNAADNGGAIEVFNSTANISNSTFSGNSAGAGTRGGGGIDTYQAGGTTSLTVTNSTFSGNSAGHGGGVRNNVGTITLKNTIIADNPGGNCQGTITDGNGNLRWPDSDSSCPGTITYGNPNLAALANNGGPTQTIALGAGSAAINTATAANCPTTDQRGCARRGANGFCDVGAFEAQAYSISVYAGSPQSTIVNAVFGAALQTKVSDQNSNGLGGVVVTFAGPGSGASIVAGGTAATNAAGISSFTPTANGTAGGPYTVTATAGGLSANFSLTNNKGNTTTTITSAAPNPYYEGQTLTVNFTVTANPPSNGTPSGNVTVSDGTLNCTGTVAAGSCTLTYTNPGSKTLTASYAGNSNFNPSTSAEFSQTINNLVPTITSLSHPSSTAGGPGFTLTVTGTNYFDGTKVRWNGSERTTTFISSTQLSATILASDIAAPGTATITVAHPAPSADASNGVTHTINAPAWPLNLPIVVR